jgi:hypothetical protein
MRSRHRRSIDRFAHAAALAATALACITDGVVGASHRGGPCSVAAAGPAEVFELK